MIRPLILRSTAEARRELERIGVDPAGIARMLPKLEPLPILVPGLRPAAANILKQELLSLGGDAAVARGTVACSIDRTDVLLIGTRKQLSGLCAKLAQQPFGLAALAEQVRQLLATLATPRPTWRLARRELPLQRPLIMGILNVTPDSFSDGGRFSTVETAVAHALQMVEQGADIIDIGAESTRPGAPLVAPDEELRRLLPVLEALAGRIAVPISIDTWKAPVAEAALKAGAEIINDISGLTFDPALAQVAANHRAGLVLMHTRGTPATMQQDTGYQDLLGEIADFLQASLQAALTAGCSPEQLVLDPGIGFGKDTTGNLEILRRLPELASLGCPLLVGSSRKRFIGTVLEREKPEDRLFGTAATVALAVAHGARILRVHDVQAMRDVVDMTHSIISPTID
ncbi:dihydropteroate synthase [Trichlorobacter sp.]|uniref:dihydropteroate synthase n=1 Tax=Trichlorobacter sp. TaxID=2911007 RepID=UPI002A36E20B|nr:dihydropteroate synthase [Trichlorobacter sp.]MDY0383538.1 dihydropteroate synthase [Trichlorobacter sp.]